MTPPSAPPLHELRIRGFLGFPHSRSLQPIPLDGDIVLLTGANGTGKSSLLEAIAYHETGATVRDEIERLVHVGNSPERFFLLKNSADPAPIAFPAGFEPAEFPAASGERPWWQTSPIDRLRHLRTVYFHPHHLRELFEENPPRAGASFADLLAPPPRAVDGLRAALKDAQPDIDQTIARLRTEAGITPDDTRNAERRSLAAALNDRIARLRDSHPEATAGLGEFSVDRLVIRSGNLRKNWEGELNNIVRKIISLSPDSSSLIRLSELPSPSESLRALATVVRRLAAANATTTPPPTTTDSRRQAIELLHTLPAEDWAALKDISSGEAPNKIESDFKLKQLAEQRDTLRHIRQTLGRGPSDLSEWAKNLQNRAANWRRMLPQANRHQLPLPEPVAQWIGGMSQLADDWTSHDGQWQEWAARLDDREKEISHEYEQAERVAENRRRVAKIHETASRALFHLPGAPAAFSAASTAEMFIQHLESISPQLVSPPPAKPSQAALAEDTARACETWAAREVEFEAENAKASSPTGIALVQRLRDLETLREAINSETTPARSRLLRLQQEAIDGALDPIQRFLSETSVRFRLSDSLEPIRLRPPPPKLRSPARLRLEVGNPPREVALTSSGQRAQLGLLVFLGLHFGLRDTYHNRLLCLDEITSSFDLAQIPRLALLLRQIAYAPASSPFKRRIFLASHNEDFTQRLANLLTPPTGCSVRILRFTGHTFGDGPTIEAHSMHPAPPFDWQAMEKYFAHRYGPAARA